MENIEEIIKNAYTQFMKGRDDFVYECDEMNALRASVAKLDFQAKNPKGSFENNGNFHPILDSKECLADLLSSGFIGFATKTGANIGKNCYGGGSRYQAMDCPGVYNDYLDFVFGVVCPDITYFTYRNLERAIIQKSEYTVSEYYGNDSIYNIELIPVKSLVRFLQDNNCLLASMVTEPPLINKAKQKP